MPPPRRPPEPAQEEQYYKQLLEWLPSASHASLRQLCTELEVRNYGKHTQVVPLRAHVARWIKGLLPRSSAAAASLGEGAMEVDGERPRATPQEEAPPSYEATSAASPRPVRPRAHSPDAAAPSQISQLTATVNALLENLHAIHARTASTLAKAIAFHSRLEATSDTSHLLAQLQVTQAEIEGLKVGLDSAQLQVRLQQYRSDFSAPSVALPAAPIPPVPSRPPPSGAAFPPSWADAVRTKRPAAARATPGKKKPSAAAKKTMQHRQEHRDDKRSFKFTPASDETLPVSPGVFQASFFQFVKNAGLARGDLEDIRKDRAGTFYVQVSSSSFSRYQELFSGEGSITLPDLGSWVAGAPTVSVTAGKVPVVLRGVDHHWDGGEDLIEELKLSNASMFEALGISDASQHVLFSHRLNRRVPNAMGSDAFEWRPSKSVKLWVSKQVYDYLVKHGHCMKLCFQFLSIARFSEPQRLSCAHCGAKDHPTSACTDPPPSCMNCGGRHLTTHCSQPPRAPGFSHVDRVDFQASGAIRRSQPSTQSASLS